jgi:uncharacterized protein YtpQ (UPF0354 family)
MIGWVGSDRLQTHFIHSQNDLYLSSRLLTQRWLQECVSINSALVPNISHITTNHINQFTTASGHDVVNHGFTVFFSVLAAPEAAGSFSVFFLAAAAPEAAGSCFTVFFSVFFLAAAAP